MDWVGLVTGLAVLVEYGLKILAVGIVPEGRRPASSSAWLLLILFLPVVGFPLYWLIGSTAVRGRRHEIQAGANQTLTEHTATLTTVPADTTVSDGLASVMTMNRANTALPCVTGATVDLYPEATQLFAAMTEAIRAATDYAHVEFYISSWDSATDAFFTALVDAAGRGVEVRLLMDHLGSRNYPGRREMERKLTAAGIDWHRMMPIDPLRGRWRRPDLRNHRKLMVVDGEAAFMGSHNLIGAGYGHEEKVPDGLHWKDLSLQVTGDIVLELQAVFATDWFTETGERLMRDRYFVDKPDLVPGGTANAFQLVPSGPGFPTEPNLRMFTALIHQATRKVAITSPYFVPDESLLAAITTAAYRGVDVELFVGEQADQFLVSHAQRSYYRTLLEAGVTIWLYPAPTVLHAKYLTVDDTAGVIGSSNMDFRSFALTYEIMLLGTGGDLVERLQASDAAYRAVSRILTPQEWSRQRWHQRYVDNVCRLTASLM